MAAIRCHAIPTSLFRLGGLAAAPCAAGRPASAQLHHRHRHPSAPQRRWNSTRPSTALPLHAPPSALLITAAQAPAPLLVPSSFSSASSAVVSQRRGVSSTPVPPESETQNTASADAPAAHEKASPSEEDPAVRPVGDSPALDARVYNIAVSSLLMGSGIGVIIPVMPLFAASIGISPAGLGLVVASMGAARLFTNVPAAWAAEHFGRKPLMVAGPAISSAGTMLCSLASSLPELLFFRALSGFGGSVQMTGSQLYLADISRPENRARTMAPLAIAFSVGMGLGPVAGGYLAQGTGLAAPFIYVGGAMLLAGLNNAATLKETKPRNAMQPIKPLREEVVRTIGQWKPIAADPSMRACLMLHSVYWGVTSGAMFTLLPLFAAEQFGVTAVELGQGFTALAFINLVGSQPAAWVSDRFGRKAVIGPATLLMTVAAVGLPIVESREALGALWVMWGVGVTCLGSTPTAYTSDINPEPRRGQALALLRSAGDIGLMTGAGAIGVIAKILGVKAGFWTAGLLLAIVGINFLLRARESVGHTSL